MILDRDTLLERANSYGLKLVTDKKELDQSGLDFLVLHADDTLGRPWIVRTPRHPNAYQGTINEAKILTLLRERLSVAIPDWRIHKPDLIAYPRLPGIPAWTYDPIKGLAWNGIDTNQPQSGFMESTAKFLAELHGLDRAMVTAAGGRERDIAVVRDTISEACLATRALLSPSEAIWRRWQTWLADDSFWPKDTAVVHGDFHPGHMLLDDSLRLIGVLDWTEAEVADPSVDFSIFFGCFGENELHRFLRFYEQAGGKTYDRLAAHVMERWAAYAPLVAQWGSANGNEGVIEHAKGHLAGIEAQMC